WGAAAAAFKPAGGGSVAPTITNLNPSSGPIGSTVTITGTNFGMPQGSSTVTFGGIGAGSATNWTTTSISVPVPATLSMGSATVIATVNSVPSNGVAFTVTPPPISRSEERRVGKAGRSRWGPE